MGIRLAADLGMRFFLSLVSRRSSLEVNAGTIG